LSVLTGDPRFNGYNNLTDVHPHKLREIQEFFEVYKRLEPKKWTKFKEWRGTEEAKKIVDYAKDLFEDKFSH
jgi:inorganic pyrophosphatase